MKKIFFLSLITYLLSLISAPFANADTACQPIYGGGQSCVTTNNIVLDKKVRNPQTNEMADNLTVNDPKYQPESMVTFQISVTNSSNKTISNIDIKDIFPQYVDFSSGTGNLDVNNKTLTFRIKELKSNEKKAFTIKGKVVDANQISTGQGVVCVVNQVITTANDNSINKDNVQFCIEKKTTSKGGFPIIAPTQITITPGAGAESLALFSLLPTALAGWLLRKYT